MNPAYDSSQRYARLIERAELYFERVLKQTPSCPGNASMRRWLKDLTATRTQELVENTTAWANLWHEFERQQFEPADDSEDGIEVPS